MFAQALWKKNPMEWHIRNMVSLMELEIMIWCILLFKHNSNRMYACVIQSY